MRQKEARSEPARIGIKVVRTSLSVTGHLIEDQGTGSLWSNHRSELQDRVWDLRTEAMLKTRIAEPNGFGSYQK